MELICQMECNSYENFHVLHLLLPKLIVIENGVYFEQNKSGCSVVENRGVETGCTKGVCKRDWCTLKYVSL